jgi:type II secretion system protein I
MIIISQQHKGFTLIEVLVALVIIAIACFAVLHIVSSSISMESRLEHHMVGTWIADNAIIDLRGQTIKMDAATNSIKDSTPMLYQNWPWEARLMTQDSFIGHYDQPVGITVKQPQPPHAIIWRLQGYIPLKQVPHA